ncbi:MAG TPA: hypothetical protein VKF62_05490, partial [Planctomycetota bacterium]|nr:hypothetical protein [Planctomycetota bacterium]
MKSRSRALLLAALLALPAGALAFLLARGSGAQPRPDNLPAAGRTDDLPSEKALAPFQGELLDLAFRAASAMPLDPHVKNRSRAQEAVVAACLELDQPRRALLYIEGIQDWRRGAAYADLAFHCARRGEPRGVQGYLDLAGRIADENAKDENAQEWRRDRIRTKIARTQVWLGEARRAEALEADLVESERGKVDAVRAMRLEAADFDRQMQALEEVVASGSLDRVQNALATYTRLLDRFYDDSQKRARIL